MYPINKISRHLSLVLKQNVLSVFAILALFAVACGGGGGGGSSSGGSGTTGTTTGVVVLGVEVVNLAKAANEQRTHYAAFSIKALNKESEGDYVLALRDATRDAPTAAEIRSSKATLTRRLLSTEVDYIYLPFHMDAPIFADGYDMTRITTTGHAQGYNPDDLFVNTLLQPNKSYRLYTMEVSGDVKAGETFTTDDLASITVRDLYGAPPANTYSVRDTDPFVFPTIFVHAGNNSRLSEATFKYNGEVQSIAYDTSEGDVLPAFKDKMYYMTRFNASNTQYAAFKPPSLSSSLAGSRLIEALGFTTQSITFANDNTSDTP